MLETLPILALLFLAHTAPAPYRKQPCKTPQLAPLCVRFHGRLATGNGTPSTRLWEIGSHHIYGIYSNQYGFAHDNSTLDNEAPELPKEVTRHITEEGGWTAYGDFEVCPLERRIKGHMQAACIESATHVFLPKN